MWMLCLEAGIFALFASRHVASEAATFNLNGAIETMLLHEQTATYTFSYVNVSQSVQVLHNGTLSAVQTNDTEAEFLDYLRLALNTKIKVVHLISTETQPPRLQLEWSRNVLQIANLNATWRKKYFPNSTAGFDGGYHHCQLSVKQNSSLLYAFQHEEHGFAVATVTGSKSSTGTITALYSTGVSGNAACLADRIAVIQCKYGQSKKGEDRWFTQAAAVDAEFDAGGSGALFLYVTFSGKPNPVIRKERLLCSFDITFVLDFFRTRTQGTVQPQTYPQPLQAGLSTLVYSNGEIVELHAANVDGQNVVLYRDQTRIHIVSQASFLAKQLSTELLQTNDNAFGSNPVRAMIVHQPGPFMDVLTDDQLIQYDINPCQHYKNCEDCLTPQNRLCGWCVFEKRCSIRETCLVLEVEEKLPHHIWLDGFSVRSQFCPRILRSQVDSDLTVGGSQNDQPVEINLVNYPPLSIYNISVTCVFFGPFTSKKFNTTARSGDRKKYQLNASPRLQCPTPHEVLMLPQNVSSVRIAVQLLAVRNFRLFPLTSSVLVVHEKCSSLTCEQCQMHVSCIWNESSDNCKDNSKVDETFPRLEVSRCPAVNVTIQENDQATSSPLSNITISINHSGADMPKDRAQPVMTSNFPYSGALRKSTLLEFFGKNLPFYIRISIGKNNECGIVQRSSSFVQCSISPSDGSTIGPAEVTIGDIDGATIPCLHCNFFFFSTQTGQETKVYHPTITTLDDAISLPTVIAAVGSVILLSVFGILLISFMVRKLNVQKSANDTRETNLVSSMSKEDLLQLTEQCSAVTGEKSCIVTKRNRTTRDGRRIWFSTFRFFVFQKVGRNSSNSP